MKKSVCFTFRQLALLPIIITIVIFSVAIGVKITENTSPIHTFFSIYAEMIPAWAMIMNVFLGAIFLQLFNISVGMGCTRKDFFKSFCIVSLIFSVIEIIVVFISICLLQGTFDEEGYEIIRSLSGAEYTLIFSVELFTVAFSGLSFFEAYTGKRKNLNIFFGVFISMMIAFAAMMGILLNDSLPTFPVVCAAIAMLAVTAFLSKKLWNKMRTSSVI